ncbi:MAG: energy-coupling factor transporter transmembrane protein EcfT [Chloroflexi bacterium]|nr:energy-coupling factor transporter transmembrane protein EcfT [Chloroflexota bacterium]
MLFTLLLVFIAFNNIVPGSDLVHLTPRAFHDLGLVVLIALTYVPETSRHWQKIKDAQAIRGHQIRGWRDWRPILIPLLVGGMERAMALAEAMVSRGYGATTQTSQPLLAQGLLLLGLGAAFAGWLLSFWFGWPGWVLMGSGVMVLLLLIWAPGRKGFLASLWAACLGLARDAGGGNGRSPPPPFPFAFTLHRSQQLVLFTLSPTPLAAI